MAAVYLRRLRGWRFVLFNAVLGLSHIVVLFNAGSYIALLPHVSGDLGGVLPSFVTWAQTDFMVGLALGFPLARYLSGRIGDYRLLIGAFMVYSVASYLCGDSQTLTQFVPARIVQGIAGGITLPIAQTMLLNEYPKRLKAVALTVWGLFSITPFTIGMPVGGYIAYMLGWRFLFYLDFVLTLIIVGTLSALLYGRGFRRSYGRFDAMGFLLLAVLLLGLQTLLNMGNDFDWLDSPFLQAILVVLVIVFPCFIIWELGERHPILDLRLFLHRNFLIGVISLTLGFFAVQGLLSLLIVQIQLLLGYSSKLAGLALLPLVLLGAPVIAVMHYLCKYIDARWLICLNSLGFAWVFYWIGLYDDPHSYEELFWPMVMEGIFLGSFFTPVTVLLLHGLSGPLVTRAAEVANLLRVAAGAFGITFQGIVLFRRKYFHQLHLADHFGGRQWTSFDPLERLADKFSAAGLSPSEIQGKFGALIKQQAAILGMNDAFLVASFLFIGLGLLVWFAHPTHLPLSPTSADELREMRAEELIEEVP
ncbi:DHA2 family efflux MFS transporter permease subunit [Nitrospirales bacterium NOB]|nr:MAG: putative multidrug resistance protein B [Nitrospira sp. OLB3]MBV6469705.1 Multidrug export protein EmrB [Nitrospirota bacterium]MCE7966966.1 DHA2 family efflux MFS transporter permease subunit [Nitrospira sp. NTP2]MCK6494452.1 DHA2 family efflux MFS transporter permease subunit [Nitrospira sp.]MDL1889008.1 DHA2 family efflux MFS transporter permease subunit [Nitrospirales bacterium NOB]MEB2340099.1 DHA2 family efflux MFS transporter permease subunit [Nitrospirales bacterium]